MPENPSGSTWLDRIWYSGAPGAWLVPFGLLYRAIVALRRAVYATGVLARQRVGVPVVVVGNLTVGGTGKTPLTAWLVAQLVALGRRPGIAARGHGRRGRGALRVTPASTAAEVGDEPLLLARRTGVPVCVAARRVEAAQMLQAAGCDVIVCDDGLQHLALARDLEIAVVDAARGFGNGRLLPAGPLREPRSALGRVDLVVVNVAGGIGVPAGVGDQALRMRLDGETALPVAGAGAPRPLSSFRGQQVHAVAGIGNPQRFFAQLRAAGLTFDVRPWPDHHAYQAADIDFADSAPVLMTEKDAVKCAAFAGARHWYVPVTAAFDAPDTARLTQRLAALRKPGDPI
jgi:tetraacyldisaccharide 4'-kinase